MSKTLFVMLCSVFILAACGEPEDTRPGKPVAQRRAAFKEILKVFEPMGVMLRTGKYEPKQFLGYAAQLKTLRDGPWSHFGPDTQYPPSHSTDAVWSQADKFAAEKKGFFDATDKLAALPVTADKAQANTAYEAVAETCKSCHKTFKTK